MTDEPETEAEKLLFRRTLIKEMQKKTEENKIAYDEISKLKSVIYALGEEITHVKDQLIILKEELKNSKESLVHVKKQNEEIFDENSGKKQSQLLNLKIKHVRRIFNYLVEDKIPIDSLM